MRILHLEHSRYPSEMLDQLAGSFELDLFDCGDQGTLYARLKERQYEVIFARLGLMIDKRVMDFQPHLAFIVTPTTGLNHIDVEEANSRGIEIISLKGESEFLSNIKSTAEHTWGLLLSLVRHIPAAHKEVLNGSWDRSNFLSDELQGKTLGIIGYGRLGKIVAQYGITFGMDVLVHDKVEAGHLALPLRRTSLQSLLLESDFVVLLISWSLENENFMNDNGFRLMKDGSYFINTSRGELVDENSLLNALQSGKLRGAALDVLRNDSSWDGKVNGSDKILEYARRHSNVIVTPHMGGYGKDSIAKTRTFVTEKFISEINSNK